MRKIEIPVHDDEYEKMKKFSSFRIEFEETKSWEGHVVIDGKSFEINIEFYCVEGGICDECWEHCLEEKRKEAKEKEKDELDELFEDCEYCECPICQRKQSE